jgi:hypothetical protein
MLLGHATRELDRRLHFLPFTSRGPSRPMSIYATLWQLRFPRAGDACLGCDWVDVLAQGVPAHIGTPTPGYGYEAGDPYALFLPPALRVGVDASEDGLRAVVFVTSGLKKGTARAAQEYVSPLLVLTGAEYASMPFQELHDRLCDALRGARPRLAFQVFAPERSTLVFDDGSATPTRERRPVE